MLPGLKNFTLTHSWAKGEWSWFDFDLRLSLALCKISKLSHIPTKRKAHLFTQKSIVRKRYSADINIHLCSSIEDCEPNGLYELIKCLQYEKCAHNKQKRISSIVWL